MIKYVAPVVIYKMIDPHHYLLMMLDRKILRGLFEHERIKPAIIRTDQGNVHSLVQLKQIINVGLLYIFTHDFLSQFELNHLIMLSYYRNIKVNRRM